MGGGRGSGGGRDKSDDVKEDSSDDGAVDAANAAAVVVVVAGGWKFRNDVASMSVVTILRFISAIAAITWPSEGFPSSFMGTLLKLSDSNLGTN